MRDHSLKAINAAVFHKHWDISKPLALSKGTTICCVGLKVLQQYRHSTLSGAVCAVLFVCVMTDEQLSSDPMPSPPCFAYAAE